MGFEGIILTIAASPDLTNLGASSMDFPDRRSIFSRRVSNLQATAKRREVSDYSSSEERRSTCYGQCGNLRKQRTSQREFRTRRREE